MPEQISRLSLRTRVDSKSVIYTRFFTLNLSSLYVRLPEIGRSMTTFYCLENFRLTYHYKQRLIIHSGALKRQRRVITVSITHNRRWQIASTIIKSISRLFRSLNSDWNGSESQSQSKVTVLPVLLETRAK